MDIMYDIIMGLLLIANVLSCYKGFKRGYVYGPIFNGFAACVIIGTMVYLKFWVGG